MSISLSDYLTASGSHPERATHPEATNEVKANAIKLLEKINLLLKELGIGNVTISSGFRPSDLNKALANSAKASLHLSGSACDIADPDGKLGVMIEARDDLKKKYGLWQENSKNTPVWLHLDNKNRGKRAKNTFIP